MFKKLFYKEDGFTLVELLVTIAILSILFGITSLSLSGVADKAQDDMCANEVLIVQSAMDIYDAVYPDLPISVSGAAATISPGDGEFADYLKTETLGTYTWDAGGGNLTQDECP